MNGDIPASPEIAGDGLADGPGISGGAQRGRPRSQEADRAILTATVELLADRGLAAMSIEEVAARAGVGKTTIYRRWPSKGLLALDAFVASFREQQPLPDTGTLRDDLLAALGAWVRAVTQTPMGPMLTGLIAEAQHDPELRGAWRDRVIEPLRGQHRIMLERAVGPVLDIGCGVGRHVVALRRRGVRAVGVEISAVAATIARERGAEVIQASAFEHPTTSEWKTILLLDGNIGIGGDATRLLRRSAALLVPGGGVLVELEAPASAPRAQRVRLEGARVTSTWMPWHFVGYEEIDQLASSAGFDVVGRWQADDRWFAQLRLGEMACRPPG